MFTSWASILFDMGASHSFISLALASSLGFMIDGLDIELHVNTLVGGIVCLNQVCRGCLLSIDDRQLCIDLIVMPNLEFDIIGMDFLSVYRALIVLKDKLFSLHPREVVFDLRVIGWNLYCLLYHVLVVRDRKSVV